MKSNTNKKIASGSNSPVTVKGAASRKLPLLAASCLVLFLFALGMASRPKPAVWIKKFKGSRYELMAAGKPYVVKGVCYNPIPIGKGQDYDWWSDPNKPWLTDGRLMQEMGVNTVRIYKAGNNPESVKKVISDMYDIYGIRTIMGHWLGFWEYPCPLYGGKEFQEKVKKEVLEMVSLYKDEPGILMWILGNENNYSCFGQVNPWSTDEIDKETDPAKQNLMRARVYYSFVNDLAAEIHKIDPDHPVALGNGELLGLEVAGEVSPEIDVVACIIYRGKSFGNIFNSLKNIFDRPILISEFGADSYDAYLGKEDQNMQAFFLEAQWRQIYQNLAATKGGAGNCIGGAMFEWTDEWWKHNEYYADGWSLHDCESNWSNPSYYFDIKANSNKNMNEEWFGIVELSKEDESGLDRRIPRKAYYLIREFWKNPALADTPRKK
ncbi:MAG: hypothetical protein WC559_02405 [Candidatus Omnitrophota bacterium]